MKRFPSSLCAVLLTIAAVHAQPLVKIETVFVGDAGNAPDTTGFGSVSYDYRIGKFEVTIGQYTQFLNSVASVPAGTHIQRLYEPRMGTWMRTAGISKSGGGTTQDPYRYAPIGNSNRPITFVDWYAAARFCNWLHNGATNGADTETGAYSLNGATEGVFAKNASAKWWIPTENEWYKAGFYKGGGTSAGYWFFPTQSNTSPSNFIGNSANQANYMAAPNFYYSVTQTNVSVPTQNYLSEVGSYTGSGSAYGTYDQAGNVYEWIGSLWDGIDAYVIRGGAWLDSVTTGLLSTGRVGFWPDSASDYLGFRVASSASSSTNFVLTLQRTGSLTNAFSSIPITADMITPDGKIDAGTLTNGNGFFRMIIEAVVK